jgi:hypothetical protein
MEPTLQAAKRARGCDKKPAPGLLVKLGKKSTTDEYTVVPDTESKLKPPPKATTDGVLVAAIKRLACDSAGGLTLRTKPAMSNTSIVVDSPTPD